MHAYKKNVYFINQMEMFICLYFVALVATSKATSVICKNKAFHVIYVPLLEVKSHSL